MEIADFFVLNKADRAGADQSISAITTMLSMREPKYNTADSNWISSSQSKSENGWQPFIVKTVASENRGIDEIAKGIERHHDYLKLADRLLAMRKERIRKLIVEIVNQSLYDLLLDR